MSDMHRAWRCAEAMAKVQTDPVWYRQQMDLPPKPSRTFSVVILIIGVLAFYGIFHAVASI